MIQIVVAMTRDRVIGREGRLPWRIPEDLKLFKRLTLGHAVLMGRKTFDSIGGKPLPGRHNIVVSRTPALSSDSLSGPFEANTTLDVCRDLESGLATARSYGREVFVIGGASLYVQTLPLVDRVIVSWIAGTFDGDVYFPEFNESAWKVDRRKEHEGFTRVVYARKK
jgi:dihydrofolate reductase